MTSKKKQPKEDSSTDILKKLKIKKKKQATESRKEAPHSVSINAIDEENFNLVAICMQNLEEELAEELRLLGAKDIRIQKRAVEFKANLELLYKANIWLRTAIKVLKPIYEFKAKNDLQLYERAKAIAWERIFSEEETFMIDYAVNSPFFTHSQFAALRLKDAIVDRFREAGKKRTNVNKAQADLRIHLHIQENRVNISLDSSGDPLFKRGYRIEGHQAPINECLAAGLIYKTGWIGEEDFFDPMCGSGTLAIEAALIASNVPPNYNRLRFAFESWKSYDPTLLSKVLGEAKAQYRPLKASIFARDIQSNSIRASRVNINAANMRKHIQLEQADFFKSPAPSSQGLMLMNPPYGERLNVSGNLLGFYEKIGSTLKHEYENWTAWIISSEIDSFKKIGLKANRKIPMMNGKLACQLRSYHLFSGKRKEFIHGAKDK